MRSPLSFLLASLLLAPTLLVSVPAAAQIGIGVSITVAPPELPVYEQPPLPGPGFIWSPGYWAWGGEDYYWVPGTWVEAPQPGYLWTPGYWGWGEGAYLWHEGYWGPHVGFYGGVNYGFGYGGRGYEGGEWRGGAFYYNRAVNNVPESVHITNVYNRTVINNVTVNRVSFNGGSGGVAARPTAQEAAFDHERHMPPVSAQVHHAEQARSEPTLHSKANHGVPAIAATARPARFTGPGVVHARGAAPVESHTGGPAGAAPQVHNPQVHSPQVHSTAPPTHAEIAHPGPPANVAQPQAHELRPQAPAGAGAHVEQHSAPPPARVEQHSAPPPPHVEQHSAPPPPHVEQHSAPPPHVEQHSAPPPHEQAPRGNEHEHEQH